MESLIFSHLMGYYNSLKKDNQMWYAKGEAQIHNFSDFMADMIDAIVAIGHRFLKSNVWDVNGAKDVYFAIMSLNKDKFIIDELYDIETLSSYKENIEYILNKFTSFFLIGKIDNNTFTKFAFTKIN